MTLIRTIALTKVFHLGAEPIFALAGLDLEIAQGEFVGITGPSGSGKSTLLYILGLLDSPSSGHYLIDGVATETFDDNARASWRNQKIGFVFQTFHLLPRATALRNVMMPLVYSRIHNATFSNKVMEDRACHALERVGLKDRLHHLPNELSGGQRQRVAIARALVNSPQLLLADEPTGNLDSKTGAEVLNIFSELHSSGVTIVMVTHDPVCAARAVRRIVLKDGRIIQDYRQEENSHVPV